MNKIKLSKIILIIAIYSVAFTLLFMSIKSYQTYLNTYKSCKSASNTNISSTKKIKNANCININKFSTTVFNNETIQKNPYKTLSQSNPKIQKNIAGHVLRLHVIANSDSDDDQKLKTGLSGISSAAQAKQYVSSKFENIKQSADYTIHENGYSYSAKVFIQNRYFPTKTYGDLTFPAGYYDALCVEIGKADGHNWWCVLFPSLCFEDATTATVPKESKEKLKSELTNEEYNSLNKSTTPKTDTANNSKIQIRSGIYDLFH